MRDTRQDGALRAEDVAGHEFALCVVGAGIAGLNALYVASGYLPRGARVLLIDRNDAPGGMWTSVYDYVRLHQPHAMFTAGDIKWQWSKPATHLASRDEVLIHMAHCLSVIAGRLDLTVLWGHSYLGADETGGARPRAHVRLAPADDPGAGVLITTDQLIDARGYAIPVPIAIPLSSARVTSLTPNDLSARTEAQRGAPTFVVGSGKTGMDTVLRLLQDTAHGPITLISGKGTVFATRDDFFPTGLRRLWQGETVTGTFRDLSQVFDGTNHNDVFEAFLAGPTISAVEKAQQFYFGLLSRAERDQVQAGLAETIPDYLSDVIDTESGPALVLRGGDTRPIPDGSVIFNCSGLVGREPREAVTLLSEHGTILTISPRAAIHFLSSFAAYFLPHLLYSGKLREAGLYVADLHGLQHSHDRKLWQMTSTTLSFANTLVMLNALPFKVVDQCGLDFDRWHPMHRRLRGLIDARLNGRKYLAHCHAALTRVEELSGIPCGPMT